MAESLCVLGEQVGGGEVGREGARRHHQQLSAASLANEIWLDHSTLIGISISKYFGPKEPLFLKEIHIESIYLPQSGASSSLDPRP